MFARATLVERETQRKRAAVAPTAVTTGPATQMLALQRRIGNAAVQRLVQQLRAPGDAAVHTAAGEGIRTPAASLPFLDRIGRSFGVHDVSGVKAHTGSEATASAQAMGAAAFATGEHVVFAGSPDLRTAAHEAAHVVQQRAGVHLSGGVGREGDPYERQADAVAEAVVRGASAEGMLDPPAGASGGGSVQRVVIKPSGGHYDNALDLLKSLTPLIRMSFGRDRAVEMLQAMVSNPGLAAAFRAMVDTIGTDGIERSYEQAATEVIAFLAKVDATLRPQQSPEHAPFGVIPHSRENDLKTVSSDFDPQTIASRSDPQETAVFTYVGNPTKRSGGNALQPDGLGGMRLHPQLIDPTHPMELMWVLTPAGDLNFGTRRTDLNLRRPHPTLVGGMDPEVISGGTLSLQDGRISEIRDDSGHFQPGRSGIEAALAAFDRLPGGAFHGGFRGLRTFGMGPQDAGYARSPMAPAWELCGRGNAVADDLRRRQQTDGKVPQNQRNANSAGTIFLRHADLLDRAGEVINAMCTFVRANLNLLQGPGRASAALFIAACVGLSTQIAARSTQLRQLANWRAPLVLPDFNAVTGNYALFATITALLGVYETALRLFDRPAKTLGTDH